MDTIRMTVVPIDWTMGDVGHILKLEVVVV